MWIGASRSSWWCHRRESNRLMWSVLKLQSAAMRSQGSACRGEGANSMSGVDLKVHAMVSSYVGSWREKDGRRAEDSKLVDVLVKQASQVNKGRGERRDYSGKQATLYSFKGFVEMEEGRAYGLLENNSMEEVAERMCDIGSHLGIFFAKESDAAKILEELERKDRQQW
ncbi:hypothetical protein VNO78_23955 [Psophocarpus tetragonolobus]|uniref:Uncharacterized protein n=1 Tax=Psophocarpus tetragonolobus TaxID=3891 RepID=A0AAN9S4J7_PSOTE